MELQVGDWYVRSFRRTDATALRLYADNIRIAQYLRDAFPHPYRERDAKKWIRVATAQVPEANFAIASGTEVIGGIGLQFFDDVFRCNAELGYWLGEPFWGRGIATRVVGAFVQYAFRTFEIEKLTAGVFAGNVASARVLEKNHFRMEAEHRKHLIKAGVFRDYRVYAVLREDFAAATVSAQP
jgi:RimJ/RimL family protein N-acetyltransferase